MLPRDAYGHAKDIIKGRWERGENLIAKSAEYSYLYALNVIKGRFKKGEKVISNYPLYSYLYAIDVIKERFPEGEKSVSKDTYFFLPYREFLRSLKK